MPRFYISDGAVPGRRTPFIEYRTKSGSQSDVLNEAQAISRGRKLTATQAPIVAAPQQPDLIFTIDPSRRGAGQVMYAASMQAGTYNYTIDWQHTTEVKTTNSFPPHFFPLSQPYTVKFRENIVGGIPYPAFGPTGMGACLTNLSQWGTNKWVSMASAFAACQNMVITATDLPHTEDVTDFSFAFYHAASLSSNFPLINMRKMTNGASCFNNVTLRTADYAAILNDLAANNPNNNVTFDGGLSHYGAAGSAARAALVARGWIITDGGV